MKLLTPLSLLAAVIITPAFAALDGDAPLFDRSHAKPTLYFLELKVDNQFVEQANFAAIYNQSTSTENWSVQKVASNLSQSGTIEMTEVKTGFQIDIHPASNNEDLITINFKYNEPPIINSKNINGFDMPYVKQTKHTFVTSILLAEGDTYCSDLSGGAKETQLCLTKVKQLDDEASEVTARLSAPLK